MNDSYVYYLETRVSYLEAQLQSNNVPFAPAEVFDSNAQAHATLPSPTGGAAAGGGGGVGGGGPAAQASSGSKADVPSGGAAAGTGAGTAQEQKQHDTEKIENLMSNIGMVSVQGASDPRYLGSTSGISFARVVFAAVKNSVSSASSERGGVRPSKPIAISMTGSSSNDATMRDSFFGLHTKPTISQAPFPDRSLGFKLVNLYFEHANPQIPILHRGEFMALFDRVYASEEGERKAPRELYMLNIVFAIGAGIYLRDADSDDTQKEDTPATSVRGDSSGRRATAARKKFEPDGHQHQPEEYHASAIVHLESFLGSSPASDRPDGFGGGLEELQAVLLLAGFALLRPVAPGLWYIIGVAVRLGIDLGLHYEDGVGIDPGRPEDGTDPAAADAEDVEMTMGKVTGGGGSQGPALKTIDARERGRREWVRDLRRRLWWCVYSFDRLVSTCVGRPFGITDQVITTEFPSLLDDTCITPQGFLTPSQGDKTPSYKHVSYHYFRLRLLQSEIMGVLQYQLAQQARASSANRRNEFIQSQLPSPYLQRFDSFRSWRRNVDRRLWEWKESAPKKEDTGVQFSPEFLELNYWQAVIMLYRQSLSVPAPLARELSPADDVSSPSLVNVDDCDDEQEVFLKVAEAGQRVLRIYRQLHRVHLVNYTYLATHHLFMAGISFLYAIWHSPLVRSRLTLDDVDFTVLAATSVLGDLMDKCPPAEACRDAFKRMSKATVQMCLSTTGFGSQASTSLSQSHAQPHAHRSPQDHHSSSTSDGGPGLNPSSNVYPSTSTRANTNSSSSAGVSTAEPSRRPAPRFDMNLRDLFPEDVLEFSVGRHNTKNSSQDNNTRDPAAAPESDATPAIYSHPHRLTSPPFDGTSSPQLGVIDPTLQSAAAGTAQQSQSFPPAPPQPPPNFSDFDFSTMDFLDSHNSHTHQPGAPFVGGGGGGIGIGVDGYGHGGGLTAVGGTSTGLDLGFGMAGFGDGVGDHDWSEGMSMDIFDGFYFGGGGGGGSGSGWNGN